MRRIPFYLLLALFLSAAMMAHARQRIVSEIGTEIGRYAPQIALNDLSGRSVTLESLKGQVVLLNFWSTLCSPCTAEMPSLNRLYTSLKDNGLQVVSVAIDRTDKPVREFVEKNNILFTVLLDSDREVFFDEFAGPSLPATYLIDRNGMIVEKFSGLQVWDAPEMKNRVLLLLGKK
jgi:peroxiredoxin